MDDWRGTPIEVGSRVVWPGGNWKTMKEGTVLDFKEVLEGHEHNGRTWIINRSWIKVKNKNGNTVRPNWDRVTVIG